MPLCFLRFVKISYGWCNWQISTINQDETYMSLVVGPILINDAANNSISLIFSLTFHIYIYIYKYIFIPFLLILFSLIRFLNYFRISWLHWKINNYFYYIYKKENKQATLSGLAFIIYFFFFFSLMFLSICVAPLTFFFSILFCF